jgi:hypothetical protein
VLKNLGFLILVSENSQANKRTVANIEIPFEK